MGIGNILGFYGFLALIPFILIYLFKPKPIKKVMPSLLFFMKDKKQKSRLSFLRRLLIDPLFFFQFIIIAILAASLIDPFITTIMSAQSGNTVIVIDSSASMQTTNENEQNTRFKLALGHAKTKLNGRISIIEAGLTPKVILENGIRVDAIRVLQSAKPKDVSTNLKNAMDIADSILEDKIGNVIVLSDFVKTKDNDDPIISKRLLNAKGHSVEFVNVGGNAKNTGIVDLIVQKEIVEVIVKNFDNVEKTITVSLNKRDDASEKQTIKIGKNSKEKLVFKTKPGLSYVKVSPEDDLPLDNIAYISSPLKDKIKILLITNNAQKELKLALGATSYINVQTAEPPIIPDIAHDIVILLNLNKDELLPGTFNDLNRYVKKGGKLIIIAQKDISQIDMKGLLPVEIFELANQTKTIIALQNEVTKDIDFGIVKKHLLANPKENSISLLNSESASSLIAYTDYSKGKVVYYGLFDSENDFIYSPDYPIFWNKLVHFLLDTEDINDYNFAIGDHSLIDKAGYYNENGKEVAYNYLDEKESDISTNIAEFLETDSAFKLKDVTEEKDVYFTIPILIFAFALLIAELLYVKFRGDL